jgi:hypothetical protein
MALPGSALAGQAAPPAAATSPAARLTGRGAVLGMAVIFTVGLLAASGLGVTAVAGILFVLGCGLAAWFTRPPDLLIVVLTPPILFSGALIFIEAMTASGSLLLSVAAGSVVVLVSLAPWLAVGLVVTVAIAVRRGLLRCVLELVRDLRADAARRRKARAARPPGPGLLPWHLLRPARAEPAAPGARRPDGTKAAGPGPRAPGSTQAARPAPQGPGSANAAGPASRSPGSTRVAGPASRGLGSGKAVAPGSRGPSNAKGATPEPGTRRAASKP